MHTKIIRILYIHMIQYMAMITIDPQNAAHAHMTYTLVRGSSHTWLTLAARTTILAWLEVISHGGGGGYLLVYQSLQCIGSVVGCYSSLHYHRQLVVGYE